MRYALITKSVNLCGRIFGSQNLETPFINYIIFFALRGKVSVASYMDGYLIFARRDSVEYSHFFTSNNQSKTKCYLFLTQHGASEH